MSDRQLQSSLPKVGSSADDDGKERPHRALMRRERTEPVATRDWAKTEGKASDEEVKAERMRRRRAQRRRRDAAQGEAGGGIALVSDHASEIARASEILPAQPISLPPTTADVEGAYSFRKLLKHTLLGFVVLPVVLVIGFYLFIAADQYASLSRLTVRGTGESASTDLASMIGGFGSSLTEESVDSYVLVDYIHSPEVVQALIEKADFLRVYTRPEADFWYRLDPNAPMEDLVDYWETMSSVTYDAETHITELVVRAFRPEDAEHVAETVLQLSETLVNELSRRAREDSLRMARDEVARAEERFRTSRAATAQYRDTQREIDPVATATSQQEILGALEGQLATREAEMNALLTTMSPQSPRVIYVRTQIEALRQQIKRQRTDLAEENDRLSDQTVLTKRLSRYEGLIAEQTFADAALVSARQSLETARVDANRQNRYLSVFVQPTVPQDSQYPEGLRWTAIVGVGLLLMWAVFSLAASVIRDHVR